MTELLKAIGFWRDNRWPLLFPHPAELSDLRWDQEEKEGILGYLNSGVIINPQLGFATCRFKDGPAEEEMGDSDAHGWRLGLA